MCEKVLKIQLNDLFKDLKHQNNRLLNENQRLSNELLIAKNFFKLCENYRSFSQILLNCKCNQKNFNKISFDLLENKYKSLINERKTLISRDFNEEKHKNIIYIQNSGQQSVKSNETFF
jgi:hypothetical protein